MTLIPELERELERVLPPRRRRFSLKLGLGLPVLLVAGTTAALAAGGVIPIGAPAEDPVQPSNPHTGLGQVTGGSSRVLGVQAADPDGGPPWGMQLVTTSRGLGCLQAGRLVNGRIGVLGRDGAFRNDGRFHPFPADGIGHPGTCASLDGAHRLIANVTLGGIAASASPHAECMPPQFTSGVPKSKLCDPDSVRILYYGTLGPQAQSIFVGSRVIPTTGDDGAYLIVDRIGNSGMGGVGVTPYPTNGPITEIRFKDGSSCELGPSGPTGPAHTCANPGRAACRQRRRPHPDSHRDVPPWQALACPHQLPRPRRGDRRRQLLRADPRQPVQEAPRPRRRNLDPARHQGRRDRRVQARLALRPRPLSRPDHLLDPGRRVRHA
jgi:hypothetical protein